MQKTTIVHISLEGCPASRIVDQELTLIQQHIDLCMGLTDLISIDKYTFKRDSSIDKELPESLKHLQFRVYPTVFILTGDQVITQPKRHIVDNVVTNCITNSSLNLVHWIADELKKIYPKNSKQNDG